MPIAQFPPRDALDLPCRSWKMRRLEIAQIAKSDMVALSRYGIALHGDLRPCRRPTRSKLAALSICPHELAGRLLG